MLSDHSYSHSVPCVPQELFDWRDSFSDVQRQDKAINAIFQQRYKALTLQRKLNQTQKRYWVKGNRGYPLE